MDPVPWITIVYTVLHDANRKIVIETTAGILWIFVIAAVVYRQWLYTRGRGPLSLDDVTCVSASLLGFGLFPHSLRDLVREFSGVGRLLSCLSSAWNLPDRKMNVAHIITIFDITVQDGILHNSNGLPTTPEDATSVIECRPYALHATDSYSFTIISVSSG